MNQSGNAFFRHQGSMFIPCEGCTSYQECGTKGNCYRDLMQQYGGQSNGVMQNCFSGIPSWQQLIANQQRDFYYRGSPEGQREIVRTSPLDAGECD